MSQREMEIKEIVTQALNGLMTYEEAFAKVAVLFTEEEIGGGSEGPY